MVKRSSRLNITSAYHIAKNRLPSRPYGRESSLFGLCLFVKAR